MSTPQTQLLIISGPSGAGKSTVVKHLLERCPLPIELSVSATTRTPRPQEQDGVDYHFLSHEEFARRRSNGEFLECMEVFGRGDWYGTLAETVTTGLKNGKWVLLEIDVQGAIDVMSKHPEVLSFFVHPGSLEELERRLRKRGTEDEEAIQRRLATAHSELAHADRYRYTIVNHRATQAADEICRLLQRSGEQSSCTTS